MWKWYVYAYTPPDDAPVWKDMHGVSGLDDKGKDGACEWNHLQRVDQFLIKSICYEKSQLKTSRTVVKPRNFKPQFKQNHTYSLLETPHHMGPVPPSAPNSCEKIPVKGPACNNPHARPHATTPVVKAIMHKWHFYKLSTPSMRSLLLYFASEKTDLQLILALVFLFYFSSFDEVSIKRII